MTFIKHTALIMSVFVAISASAAAQVPSPAQLAEPQAARSAAMNALSTFRQLENAGAGLSVAGPGANSQSVAGSVVNSQDADVGSPVQEYVIGLNKLRQWDRSDPGKLLTKTGRLVYPIVAGGSTQASVTIAPRNGSWRAVAFNSLERAQEESAARDRAAPNAPGAGPEPVFETRIPALNLIFMASKPANDLLFTPLSDYPEFHLTEGKTEPARDVLLRLQPVARQLNPTAPH